MGTKTVQYPAWVEKYNEEGMTIKFIRGKYYLYKRLTSRRIPGKKNPQPVDEYVGVITEDGLKPAKKNRIDVSDVQVWEYGFSYSLMQACPESWKQTQGENWEAKLYTIIKSRSKNAYILKGREWTAPRMQLGSTVSSLSRKFNDAYKVTLEELQTLDTIYLVEADGKKMVSRVAAEQQAVLDKIGVRLEVH